MALREVGAYLLLLLLPPVLLLQVIVMVVVVFMPSVLPLFCVTVGNGWKNGICT